MAEKLGKIEKPLADDFKAGRKLYFVPLIFGAPDLPLDISLKYSGYWDQVDTQIANLESKLGEVSSIFHEMIYEGGDEGLKALEQMNSGSISLIRSRIEKGAKFEAAEDGDLITELMDWSRCMSLGLQNQKVFNTVYQNYTESNNKRNEFIAKRVDELLKESQSCIMIMTEGHHVKFPADIQVFYVAPPALDEIKRWNREQAAKQQKKEEKAD